MKKILFFIGLFCATSFSMWGQPELEKINSFKKNLNFIYAIGTSTVSAQEATEIAKDLLTLKIDQWLKEVTDSGDYSGYVAKAQNKVEVISTRSGTLVRSFVYVRKVDILPYYKEEDILMVTNDAAPVAKTQPVSSESHTLNSTVKEGVSRVTQQAVPAFAPTSKELELLSVHNLSEINSFLSQGTHDGTVIGYGRYDSSTNLVGKTYLFLINNSGEVIATLRKYGTSVINLSSGSNVSVNDYGKCGIIWFQINE